MLSNRERIASTTTPLAEQKRVGRYRLIRHLATGGMGEVFVAQLNGPADFRRQVVLKTIRPELLSDHEFRVMFEQEARVAGLMDHANICRAFEFGYDQGRPYLVMEYLSGVGMDKYIRQISRGKDLSDVRVSLSLLLQACHGLHYAHELCDDDGQPAAIVHRDVTPSNLIVGPDGVLRILDFGIARTRARLIETRTGAIKGKYCYMPPEQVQGHQVDRRADVFSLGILLWEAIVGQPLFSHSSEYETIRAVVEEKPPSILEHRPGLVNVAVVVARALEKSSNDRYSTARALGSALMAAMRADGVGEPLAPFALADELARRLPEVFVQRRQTLLDASDSQAMPTSFDERNTGNTAIDFVPDPPANAAARVDESNTPVVEVRTVVTAPPAHPAKRIRKTALLGAIACAAVVLVFIVGRTNLSATAPVAAERRIPENAGAAAPKVASAAPLTSNNATPENTHVALVQPPVATDDTEKSVPTVAAPPKPAPRGSLSKSETKARPHKQAGKGSFTMDARPYGTVYIDGKKVAVTPLVKHPLPAGRHLIKVRGSNGRQDSFTVKIKAGQDAPAKLIMLE